MVVIEGIFGLELRGIPSSHLHSAYLITDSMYQIRLVANPWAGQLPF
jgi:hypothetical protein